MIALNVNDAVDTMKIAIAAGRNVFLHGAPGLGKTQCIKQMVKQLTAADICSDKAQPGDERKPVRCVVLSATTMESVDVRGLIHAKDGRTVWLPPAFIPVNEEPCVVFIDEFPQADESVQIAIQKLVDRDLDCVNVSSRAVFVLAGNRRSDNSGVRDIPQHIRRRFMHIEVKCDTDAWCKWAEQAKILPVIIDFIQASPQNLNTFNPESDEMSYCTPASLEILSDILKKAKRKSWPLLASAQCGETWAASFAQHLSLADKCPNIGELLENIDKNPDVPKEMGIQRMVVQGALRLTVEDDKRAVGFMKLLDLVSQGAYPEFAVAGLKGLLETGKTSVAADPIGMKIVQKLSKLLI